MDRIGAVAMLLFGIFWAVVGSRYPMVSRDGGPGAGVLPTALGVIIACLALASFFRPEVERIELPHLGRILIILGALAGYALLLEPVGYVVATALILTVLLTVFAEGIRWFQPVVAVGHILIMLAALVGYHVLIVPFGYIVAAAFVLAELVMVYFVRPKHTWQPVAAVSISFFTYAIFRLMLSVPLPPDPFELVR